MAGTDRDDEILIEWALPELGDRRDDERPLQASAPARLEPAGADAPIREAA